MSVFGHVEFDNHERVVFCSDEKTGLRALIAVHSTAIGPAAGGCRMWNYLSDDEALTDALRLSRGMSYKNALAEIRFGGGKSVIIGDAQRDKTAEMFRAFGRCVDQLGGDYITAEDVGVRVPDMEEVATQTRFVSGLSQRGSNAGGDPSPWTARGVHVGIQAAAKLKLNADSLEGMRVAVQGLGGVGYNLCALLHQSGAILTVADINSHRVEQVCQEFGATAVSTDEIIAADVDVFSPCALGAVIDDRSLELLQAKIVAGAANNQLALPQHGDALHSAGVLYAPDYVINAGGIISAEGEYFGDINAQQVADRVDAIGGRLNSIFLEAEATNTGTHEIADALAQEKIAQAGKRKETQSFPEKLAS